MVFFLSDNSLFIVKVLNFNAYSNRTKMSLMLTFLTHCSNMKNMGFESTSNVNVETKSVAEEQLHQTYFNRDKTVISVEKYSFFNYQSITRFHGVCCYNLNINVTIHNRLNIGLCESVCMCYYCCLIERKDFKLEINKSCKI